MADPFTLTVLEYGHIISAIGWLGGGLLITFVLGPGLQTVSPPARLEFLAKVMPRILNYIVGMIAGTILFGLLLLYFFIGGDFSMLSPSTTFGTALSAGIGLAVITVIIAVTMVVIPTRRIMAIAQQVLKSGETPPPELMKLSKRARMGSVMGAVLLLVVVVLMVSAGFY